MTPTLRHHKSQIVAPRPRQGNAALVYAEVNVLREKIQHNEVMDWYKKLHLEPALLRQDGGKGVRQQLLKLGDVRDFLVVVEADHVVGLVSDGGKHAVYVAAHREVVAVERRRRRERPFGQLPVAHDPVAHVLGGAQPVAAGGVKRGMFLRPDGLESALQVGLRKMGAPEADNVRADEPRQRVAQFPAVAEVEIAGGGGGCAAF